MASRYYLNGQLKTEIADELGLSRFKVARMLETARDRGLVRIQISMPDSIDPDLSSQVAAAFGLRQAVIIDTPDDPIESLRADLGRVAGELLVELVQGGDIVGLAWGRTLDAMASALTRLRRCSVVQLTGVLSAAGVNDTAIELVQRMSAVSGVQAYRIYAPLILDSPAVARSLRSQAELAETVACYDRITVAVVPIGSWDPPHSQVYDALSEGERRELLDAGVRADTSTMLLSAEGEVITAPLSDRMFSITWKQLRQVPEVVAVAGGTSKADAIGIALRSGFVTTLVTNSTVARHLLHLAPLLHGPR